jgi:FkbM family methyltransferase
MNQPMESTEVEVRNIRGEQLLRVLQRVFPLGRHYHSLLAVLNSDQGLLRIPFDSFGFVIPAAWRKLATNFLLCGPNIMPEFCLLKPIIQNLKSGCLVDVGANIGLYTLFLRSNSPLPIVAYEPQPILCNLARRSVALNRFADIEVRNVGCGAERGEVAFHNNPNGSVAVGIDAASLAAPPALTSTDWEVQTHRLYAGDTIAKIPIVTLDEDLADKPSIAFLKIDCEGYEHQILQGAWRLIERHRPHLFIEVHPTQLENFGSSTEQVLNLVARDYDLEFWHFQIGRHTSKLARSLAKFQTPKAHRFANAKEMLAAAKSTPGPAQIYFIGRPKEIS